MRIIMILVLLCGGCASTQTKVIVSYQVEDGPNTSVEVISIDK